MMVETSDTLPRRGLRIGAASALVLLLAAGRVSAQGAVSEPTASDTPEATGQSAAGARSSGGAGATERAGRVASLLELASTEYADAVADGEIINAAEYEETQQFTREARGVFEAIGGPDAPDGAAGIDARFDSLLAIVEAKRPPAEYERHVRWVSEALARTWGAVSVATPDRRPSAAQGAKLYREACAACHGPAGEGDGWAADGMNPPPPDLTAPIRRTEGTPARDYQVVLYGIPATAMPSHGDWLSVEEAWDVVAYVQSLRFGAAGVAEGKGLALEGGERGPVAGRLRSWASVEGTARLSDLELRDRIRVAWREASSSTDSLTTEQADAVVAYVRSLMGTPHAGVPETDRAGQLADRVEEADSLAHAAAALATDGEHERARSTALRAYMVFEGVEPDLRSRAPDLVRSVERSFATFREDVSAEEGADVTSAREELVALLADARSELTSQATVWTLATQSFFIILREGFEAILIIGAILTFLLKTGHEERRRDIYWGVGVALAASVATAFVMESLLAAAPASREALEGLTMLLAVAVLFSVSYWLLSKLEHEKWEAYLRTKMQRAVGAGSGLALAGVAFLAVYREGFETVLFYKALVGFSDGTLLPVVGGFVVGCVALAAIYVAFTRFGVKVPMRPFFGVTSGVLYYMAVVFAGNGVRELQEAGWIGTTYLEGVPTIDLVGVYPTAETLAAQGVLLGLLAAALWLTFGRDLFRSAGSAAESRAGGASRASGAASLTPAPESRSSDAA